MFQPDKGHIHHAFLRMGLSSRNAVFLIYGISMVFCVAGILVMLLRGRGIEGFVMLILLVGMIFLMRKLGYIEYLAVDKFYGWFQDMTDVAGFSQARRSFLSLQIEVGKSRNIDELWARIGDALEMLKFDKAELHYKTEPVREWIKQYPKVEKTEISDSSGNDTKNFDSMMRIEIPLVENTNEEFFGKLILIKDLNKEALRNYTIRRVEHLRRTILANIIRLKNVKGEERE
jgi:UDP-GlcNAc:undecaprenyl-phosphate GlcNAc-1-phosphate transferase